MNLGTIKNELEKEGLFAGIKNNMIQSDLLSEVDNDTGITILKNSFRVSLIEENEIILSYSYGQIPITKSFYKTTATARFPSRVRNKPPLPRESFAW